ncbi:MAG: CBS domain-containing protein [Deltaproteobacteria bacterium]|nr:CBS domain-containing protein [Deltaproteobacteria bacterium]
MIASEVMTPTPVTAAPDETIAAALGRMAAKGFRHLPVVDADGRFLGMVSDRSLKALLADDAKAEKQTLAAVLSGAEAVTASPSTPVATLADRMLANSLRAVPVVDDAGSLVGIVSYVDVVRASDVGASKIGPGLGVESVLVPIGPDDLALDALRLVANLFVGAEIHALHVLGVPTGFIPTFLGGVDSPSRASQATEGLGRRIAALGLERAPKLVVRLGDAADEIVEYAKDADIRLVVMPSRQHHGVKRVLLGSVTEHVTRNSPCPVLVLRGDLPETWARILAPFSKS